MNARDRTALIVLAAAVIGSPAAWGEDNVLSGIFNGAEPTTASLPGGCGGSRPLGYRQSSFTVNASGTYTVYDLYNFVGVDVTALIYENSFSPGNPQQNLETPNGIDVADDVQLTSGTSYLLVVQHWCEPAEGAWAVSLSGPGVVTSSARRNVPDFTSGSFGASDPVADTVCGDSQYEQIGPIQVAQSGTHYYVDGSINFAVDMCLQVFSAPFNASNPSANLIDAFDDFGQIELETGRSYYLVVQPLEQAQNGDYFFVLAPPAPFRLNPAMGGSWYNPDTAGQGFFMDVFDNINQVFLAWFTYDLMRPDDSVEAEIGDPGHRWLTAFGPFEGTGAELDIEWTRGGVFDSSVPAPTQSVDGTISVEFDDCLTGTVTYDLGSTGTSGVVPIQRIANDSQSYCEALTLGPGMPGPL